MNILYYLTSHVFSSFSYFLLKPSPPLALESNQTNDENPIVDMGKQGFIILLPDQDNSQDSKIIINENPREIVIYDNGPIILYHEYIDEVIKQYSNNLFILRRFRDMGITMVYLMRNLQPEQITKYFIEIQLIRQSSRILIRYNGSIYEWYPITNTLYGHDNLILIHFKNRPFLILYEENSI